MGNESGEGRENKRNDQETQIAYEKVIDHFKGDQHSANEWFYQSQKKIGGKCALNLIGEGRAACLNKFIDKDLRGKK